METKASDKPDEQADQALDKPRQAKTRHDKARGTVNLLNSLFHAYSITDKLVLMDGWSFFSFRVTPLGLLTMPINDE